MNASLVGGSEQSFTDDAPLFPVLQCHIFTMHSVTEVHDRVILPYAAHINSLPELQQISCQP